MKAFSKWMMATCLVVLASSAAQADFTQIPGVFAPVTFGGGTVYQSVFDTGSINPGEIRNFSVAYDNFSSATTGVVTQLSWIGKFDTPGNPRTTTFHVDFFADNAGQPNNVITAPTPIQSYIVTATETATPVADYFQYTASIPSFLVNANTTYWLSILGEQPYGQNAFGWAFTNGANNTAFGDFQGVANGPITRFNIGADFAFNATITAVPEPSSCLLLAGAIGTIGFRKLRARRKATA